MAELKRHGKGRTLITPLIDTLSQRVDNYSKDADMSFSESEGEKGSAAPRSI